MYNLSSSEKFEEAQHHLGEHGITVSNVKLDVKKLIQTKDNLEQWETIKKQNFPISNQLLINEIFPALGQSKSGSDIIFFNRQLIFQQYSR